MSNPLSFEMVPISPKSCSNFCNPFLFHGEIPSTSHLHLHLRQRLLSSPSLSSSSYSFHLTTKYTHTKQSYSTKPIPLPLPNLTTKHSPFSFSLESLHASNVSTPEVDEKAEVEVAKDPSPTNVSTPGVDEKPEVEVAKDLSPSNVTAPEEEKVELEVTKGYTMTQLCDKMIEVFMNEKPKTKDWRKLLVFREEWKKYRESFYNRCQARAETENDSIMKQKLIKLGRKVMKIDEEMERHDDLLKEVQQHPMDINTVVADRRKDFTGEFFNYLTLLSDTCYSLEDRDAMSRLGAKCLSAVYAYDNAVENLEMLDAAQSKFDDILNSPSLDAACDKIKNMAKTKELDSSLILLINKAWASAKESTRMKNEVKDIMYRLYKTTKSSLKSMAPKEIKLLKYLLNIIDPEERFSALATAFSPGDGCEPKDVDVLYTTPKELHKWIKIMLDAYHLNKEDTDLREAKEMTQPMVIQRLFILMDTIETEYLKQSKADVEAKEAEKEDLSL